MTACNLRGIDAAHMAANDDVALEAAAHLAADGLAVVARIAQLLLQPAYLLLLLDDYALLIVDRPLLVQVGLPCDRLAHVSSKHLVEQTELLLLNFRFQNLPKMHSN